MLEELIEFRWLQDCDGETEAAKGPPVLQWRIRFEADGDHEFIERVNFSPWRAVPVVLEDANRAIEIEKTLINMSPRLGEQSWT